MSAGFGEVGDVLDNYRRAVHEQDADRFLSAYAGDVHIYDCWDTWECVGIENWRVNVEDWFNGLREESVLLHADFSDVVVEESPTVAFVRCAVTFAAYDLTGNKLRQVRNRFTFGMRKKKDGWVIQHEHSSLPIKMTEPH